MKLSIYSACGSLTIIFYNGSYLSQFLTYYKAKSKCYNDYSRKECSYIVYILLSAYKILIQPLIMKALGNMVLKPGPFIVS